MKSATLRKAMGGQGGPGQVTLNEDPNYPKRFWEEPSKQMDKDQVRGTMWYEEYFLLEEKIERMKEENQKMKREITRRTERYVKNEAEYREEINELEKDMRIRRGFSDTNGKGDPEAIDKINTAICGNIDGYKEQYNLLVDE